ncbi:MAG: TfoX/Sxy family protein [Bradyrhizobiaceae bacterium]|nr:TfoX/Sxy family protein [Bradyrhizobiaceae bacterium]
MFGGAGVFADGLMIALIAYGELFLKADGQTIPAFQAEGTSPFEYGAKGRRVIMSYWRMPERLFDDQDELAQWARDAFRAAQRSAAKPAKRKSHPKAGKPEKGKKAKQR